MHDAYPEMMLRIGAFVSVFAVMAVMEVLMPRRPLTRSKARRWLTNLGIVVLNTVLLRIAFPLLAVGIAIMAQMRGWGLFNITDEPMWLEFALAIVALDLAIYLQHVAAHKIPLLWWLHQVHHADPDIDLTTGARFHPLEIILSMFYKMAVVLALGAPPWAVVVFEVILNALAMFNHANFALPARADALLRRLFVTPDFHRVHHSVIQRETDSNYGFNLSIWDRLFGTYIAQPAKGHQGMEIGLEEYRDKAPTTLLWCLKQPFVK
ncbi:MAG: fatty acid hydroxylase [Hyphomicrobiales bacterium]|nr:MAG: fatty acid hydroxylase [Hyphomicrobiales bacterium]